jgi:predicted DNA-binding ribbon-helix-helix protein
LSKSPIAKRSVFIGDRKTSVSLEDEFWTAIRQIAAEKGITTAKMFEHIDMTRAREQNLSSAIRLFVLDHFVALTRVEA